MCVKKCGGVCGRPRNNATLFAIIIVLNFSQSKSQPYIHGRIHAFSRSLRRFPMGIVTHHAQVFFKPCVIQTHLDARFTHIFYVHDFICNILLERLDQGIRETYDYEHEYDRPRVGSDCFHG